MPGNPDNPSEHIDPAKRLREAVKQVRIAREEITTHGLVNEDVGERLTEIEWTLRGIADEHEDDHRLAAAEPAQVPDDAERDADGEAVLLEGGAGTATDGGVTDAIDDHHADLDLPDPEGSEQPGV